MDTEMEWTRLKSVDASSMTSQKKHIIDLVIVIQHYYNNEWQL